MASYSRSDYGLNPHAGKLRNNAAGRGWGPGWPNCQTSKMVKVRRDDHAVFVRREISELVATLFAITAKYGYDVNPTGQVNQTWGFACRAIRGTRIASNHSWGLAVDINSLSNPMQSTFKSNIPPVVIAAWEACGWYWGGRYGDRPDAMHLEFIGTPAQVSYYLAVAKGILSRIGRTQPPAKAKFDYNADALRAAARGADQQGDHYGDARQFVAMVVAWQAKYRKNEGGSLEATQGAWLATWDKDIRDRARRGPLFTYLVKYWQAGHSLPQDGIIGPATIKSIRDTGYSVSNA